MTLRRRFFPSTPVQQAPGQTVQLEVQMRPEAPVVATPGGCECDVIGVGWFSTLLAPRIDASSLESEDFPGHTEVETWLPQHSSRMRTVWVRPADDELWTMPLEGPERRCVRIEIWTWPESDVSLFGAVIGTRLCDVTWQLQWDAPGPEPGVSALGQTAVAAGSGLWVMGRGIEPDRPDQSETLTATATCDGKAVGVLTLMLHHEWPA